MPTAETGTDAVRDAILAGLARVQERFDRELEADLPAVALLCSHVERYRGKMLRPTLLLACGLAADGGPNPAASVTEGHITSAAVCELIHMATLVHDDVLDEAEVRRRGRTINSLRGNEAAVILGDYLIAAAYRLCSTLGDQSTAELVGRVSMTLCAGELLQLHRRDDASLDEATYLEIVDRKTGSLIGLACRLGAMHARRPAGPGAADGLDRFGRLAGVAFQIQDDLLDLTGDEAVVGKSLHKDLEKGKLTLPVIHHLGAASPADRGRTLRLLSDAARGARDAERAAPALVASLHATGSIDHARDEARRLVRAAKAALGAVPESAARAYLLDAADAVVARAS